MGLCCSDLLEGNEFTAIKDQYSSIIQIKQALKDSGLESSNLLIGIDFTASNVQQGAKNFYGKSLHTISNDRYNPYQQVISIMCKTLSDLDEDGIIPVFGFGDSKTKNYGVFPLLSETSSFCHGFEEVLASYNKVTPTLTLSGPTNFAPIIEKALEIIKSNQKLEYHILLIITDGQVSYKDKEETINAIVKASGYPLSIIVVGVGDGPWENMNQFDDELPTRKFDNFQFVDFHATMKRNSENQEDGFAVSAMMEIPEQYKLIRKLKIL